MTRTIRLVLVGAMLAAGLIAGQPSASAAPCVRIYKIWYDSLGKDTGSNASLNGEWIRLRNYCGTAKSLTGWRIRDVARHVYTFGTFKLGPGKYVEDSYGKRYQHVHRSLLGPGLVRLEQRR